MNTVSSCPHCRPSVQIPEEMLGKPVRCPLCAQVFIAGGAESMATSEYDSYIEPHRGGVILSLGILSVGFYCIGLLVGPIAWVMGSRDLTKMKHGTMDKSGYGITQVGYVLGIVGTILGILFLLWLCFVVVMAVTGMVDD